MTSTTRKSTSISLPPASSLPSIMTTTNNDTNATDQLNHDQQIKHRFMSDKSKWYPFKGIVSDLQDRLPYYVSDWTDGWNYRVIPATILTFFTNIFPAIAFAQDMFDKTNNSYGVNEVLLSSALAGIVFGIFSGQPLTIVGVTGPISIFNYTVYEIIEPLGVSYFPFMFWISIWGMIFHFILSIFNCVNALRYVTNFPCDIFGLFINVVYLQKGLQILSRQFNPEDNGASGFASVMLAISMGVLGFCGNLFKRSPFVNHHFRQFVVDYSTPILIVLFTGMIHFGGYFQNIEFKKLPITRSFHPTSREHWIDVTDISVGNIFLALPFGIVLSILFYFDHSISALICQNSKYKLKKPASFHYDLFLLGITTGVAGLLGIPCPNGLIPQAPLHTESLLLHDSKTGAVKGCVEQRITNTVQGLMLLGMMTRPLLVCLGLIPQCVLAGLFFIMGSSGIFGNVIFNRMLYLVKQKEKTRGDPLNFVSKKNLIIFLILSLCGFVAEFAIVETKGAIGFPLVLLLSVIVSFFFGKWFPDDELEVLDGPVAHENTTKNL
ncbi:hypothetical protein WICPIJ_002739 [Wickerhamomyces pijperi]|uniref:Bicarbonate transporter-like transmembrane domain-containing protein n=1 Tax=Wickerhamomyces pijperi TaxID=599730 RepID=A0A9P8QB63_WICPI|nr:hypothetical protein WICPIJ_002739 [Wickerhamomyces pijperi]